VSPKGVDPMTYKMIEFLSDRGSNLFVVLPSVVSSRRLLTLQTNRLAMYAQ